MFFQSSSSFPIHTGSFGKLKQLRHLLPILKDAVFFSSVPKSMVHIECAESPKNPQQCATTFQCDICISLLQKIYIYFTYLYLFNF